MSAAAPARSRPQPEVEPVRTRLRVVATRPLTAARLPFALFVGSILVAGLVALLLLHTWAAQDAFRLEAMQHESAGLADTEQQLALAEQQREAPDALAARARALGMVPTGSIAFVELHHHGKIVGVVQAALPPPPPAPSASPTPSPSANASTRAVRQPSGKATAKPTAAPSARASAKPAPSARSTAATTRHSRHRSPHR